AGIDCSAPRHTRKKYGNVNHVLTSRIETLAMLGSKSHGTLKGSTRLTTPKSSFKRPAQTRMVRKPGIAYGTTSAMREQRWKRSFFVSVTARKRATAHR